MTKNTHTPSSILVTGGAGFIGANYLEHVLGTDEIVEITTLDALTYAGSLDNLAGVTGIHGTISFAAISPTRRW
jgi:dTDP-D-glucose 4,6-dehydratase